jgi:hypothetical protein
MKDLSAYIEEINAIFRKEEDRYKAHSLCRPLLLEMAKDRSVLYEIIRKNILRPGFWEQKRINPVIALDIEANETVSFVAHCWMPLPDRDTTTTHQSIHHHGKLLLTSVAAFGPGYESLIFKKGFSIDKSTGLASMQLDKVYRNDYLNIEFIDANTPHVVFYPPEFSITYALWTNDAAARSEGLKKIGFINRYKKQLRKAIDFFGLAGLLGLNTVEYLDFYPENGKIIGMKKRIMYPVGSNASFIKGFFSMLRTVEYPDMASLRASAKDAGNNKALIEQLITALESKSMLEDDFEKSHLSIEFINLKKRALAEAFGF